VFFAGSRKPAAKLITRSCAAKAEQKISGKAQEKDTRNQNALSQFFEQTEDAWLPYAMQALKRTFEAQACKRQCQIDDQRLNALHVQETLST